MPRKGQYKDKTGQVFGNVKVISFAEFKTTSSTTLAVWNCECLKCGRFFKRDVSGLNAKTHSCGCQLGGPSDLIGKRHGMFEILRLDETAKERSYICKCDCGTEKVITSKRLVDGDAAQSCGCIRQHTKSKNLVGKRYGKLTVKEFLGYSDPVLDIHGKSHRKGLWKVLCDCGNEKISTTRELNANLYRSCGCALHEPKSEEQRKKQSKAMMTHGQSKTKTKKATGAYISYRSMMQRCYFPGHKSYAVYGGAGILVDEDWHNFENFYRDMGDRPAKHTLGRKDGTKGYSKENCQWETPEQQGTNRKTTVFIEFNGKKQSISQWARELGISGSCISRRIQQGWTTEQILTTPSDLGNARLGFARVKKKRKLPPPAKGVYFRQKYGTFYVRVYKNGKCVQRHGFKTFEEANTVKEQMLKEGYETSQIPRNT